MSEIRLIDANNLRKKAKPMVLGEHGFSASVKNWFVSDFDIQHAPTIDAVQVVRCRNCEHGKPIRIEHKHRYSEGILNCACLRADADCFGICAVWPDGYCDEGERRQG